MEELLSTELTIPAITEGEEEEYGTIDSADTRLVADEVDEIGAAPICRDKQRKPTHDSVQIRRWDDIKASLETARKRAEANVAESDYSFVHSDEDTMEREISEIFSYWEWREVNTYRETLEKKHPNGLVWWSELPSDGKSTYFEELLDGLDASLVSTRRENAQILLCLSLGIPEERATALASNAGVSAATGLGLGDTLRAFAQPSTSKRPPNADPFTLAVKANELLQQCGAYPVLAQTMCIAAHVLSNATGNEVDQAESDMRLYMNLLCVFVQLGKANSDFCSILSGPVVDDHPLIELVIDTLDLMDVMPDINLPVRKLLILLWKLVVGSLGSCKDIDEKKDNVRQEAGVHYTSTHTKTRIYHLDNFEMETQERIEGGSFHIPYSLRRDTPSAVDEAHKILKDTVFVPPSELQRRLEEGSESILRALIPDPSPVEMLYRYLLKKLSPFCIRLLKILLASLPMEEYKGAYNLTSELGRSGPGSALEDQSESIAEGVQWTMDYARHKEIIAKAISSFFLVWLKHLRFNHIYQFEYVCQLLVDFNMVVLVLKYLNQDLASHLEMDGDMPALEMLPKDTVDESELRPQSWRNFSTTLNMLRILQKLTKRNPLRIKIVMQYKGTATIKALLKIKHPLIRLYALKLLKNQIKYLGANWKKNNMKIISAIYTHVRPEMCDDWLISEFGVSDVSLYKRQDEEFRQRIADFNKTNYLDFSGDRETNEERYDKGGPIEDFQDYAKYSGSVRGMNMLKTKRKGKTRSSTSLVDKSSRMRDYRSLHDDKLDPEFEANYLPWLMREVLWKEPEGSIWEMLK